MKQEPGGCSECGLSDAGRKGESWGGEEGQDLG